MVVTCSFGYLCFRKLRSPYRFCLRENVGGYCFLPLMAAKIFIVLFTATIADGIVKIFVCFCILKLLKMCAVLFMTSAFIIDGYWRVILL